MLQWREDGRLTGCHAFRRGAFRCQAWGTSLAALTMLPRLTYPVASVPAPTVDVSWIACTIVLYTFAMSSPAVVGFRKVSDITLVLGEKIFSHATTISFANCCSC